MGIKKLKQKVATALVVTMTATNVLSAFAAETVGQPNTKREVAVTFNSGAGYFETASKSSAATFSNVKKTELTQDDAKIATQSSIERTFMMNGEGFDAYVNNEQLFKNSDGYYYVNLDEADHWFAELAVDESLQPEMLKIEDGSELAFAGWYDNSERMPKVIGNNTEIYDGAVLDAGWKIPQKLPETVDKAFDELVAVGLPQDAKLVLDEVKEEDKKEHADLSEELVRINDSVQPGESIYELVENTPIIPVDINIENLESNATGKVTVVLPTPEGLKDVELDAGERIIAIHFAKNGTYIIPVEFDSETGNMSFELDLSQGFSPFFFVKAKVTEKEPEPDTPNPPVDPGKVTVKVTGSDDGYIVAWTNDRPGWTYLPVNEDVTFEKGTIIYFSAVPHGNKRFISYTITDKDSNKLTKNCNPYENICLPIEYDCVVTPEFITVDDKDGDDDDYDKFYPWIEPEIVSTEGMYEGKVQLAQWNASIKDYERVTEAVFRVPTAEDRANEVWNQVLTENNYYKYCNNWEFFNYDASRNVVTSKDILKTGGYMLPLIATYKGEEFLIYVWLEIGATMHFVQGFYPYNDKIIVEDSFRDLAGYDDRYFNYTSGDTWSEIDELLKNEPLDFEPRMYNYEFAGWQTLDGVKYESGTRLVPNDRDAFNFYAVAIFTKDGKAYFGNKTGGNQDDKPNNNNTGGSTSSGGGSRRHVVGGSSSTITSMTGSWTMGENGWKFLKTNGEYATNTWGYINNQWYYFNEAGDMVTGWQFINGRWYYLNPAEGSFQGAMLTGVIFDPFYNAYFYADANGAMITGWYQVADKWYYFNPISDGRQGALLADTVIDGYYVGADGAWIPGN